MRWQLLLALVFIAYSGTSNVDAQSFSVVPSPSVCASVLNYTAIFLPPGYTTAILENAVTQAPNLWSVLPVACRRAVAFLQCSTAYIPAAGAGLGQFKPCANQCVDVLGNCPSAYYGALVAFGMNLNCSDTTTYPASPTCNGNAVSGDAKSPFIPRCEALAATSVCAGVISYPIYVPWYLNQTDLEAKLAPTWWVTQLASNNSATGNCQLKINEYICSQAFPRCDSTVLSVATGGAIPLPVPFPRFPCRSTCTSFAYACTQLIGTFSAITPNCTSIGVNVAGYVDFPVYNTTFATLNLVGVGPVVAATQCSSFSSAEESAITFSQPAAPTGSCQTLAVTSVCRPYLDYTSVFVPPGYTLAALEAKVSSITTLFSVLNSTLCAKPLGRFLCGQAYMRCDTPRQTCYSSCAAWNPTYGGTCTSTEAGLINAFVGSIPCTAFPQTSYSAGCSLPSTDATKTTVVQAPKCEAIASTSICASVISYPVYIPYNANQAYLESLILPNYKAFLVAPLANGCREQFLQYACSQVFNQCDNTVLSVASFGTLPFPIPFPRFPCRSICTNFTTVCPAFIYGNKISVNCTTVGTRAPAGLADWPVATSVLASVAGVTLSTTCNSWSTAQVAAFDLDDKLVCPGPLVVPDDKSVARIDPGFGQGTCALPCPSVIYTRTEWEHAAQFFFAMSLCSFVLTLFTMATWILAPAKRKQRYILCFNICVFGVAFATLIPYASHNPSGPGGIGGNSWIGCRNNVEVKNQSDPGWCLFQAIWLYFWAFAGIVWWNIQAFDVFFKIVLGKTKLTAQERERKHRIYHTIAWSMPIIGLIIGLSTKSMGHQNVLPWCFIGGNTWAEWAIFYHPVLIMCSFSIGMMITVICHLARSSRASGSSKKPGWWKIHVRPVLFLCQFFVLFIFIYIYRGLQYFKESDYHDSALELVTCLLSGGGSTCGQADGMLPSDRPPKSLWYLIMFAVGAQGFVHFFLYGTMGDNYTFWYKLMTCKDVKGTIGRSIGDDKGSSNRTDNGTTKGNTGSSAGPVAPHVAYEEEAGNLVIHRGDDGSSRGDSSGRSGVRSVEQEMTVETAMASPRGHVEQGGQLQEAQTPVPRLAPPAEDHNGAQTGDVQVTV